MPYYTALLIAQGAPVQTLRPTADITVDSWTTTEGTDLWDELDEITADDAISEITAPSTNGATTESWTFEVRLAAAIGKPIGARNGVSLFVRARADVVDGNAQLDLRLMEASTVRALRTIASLGLVYADQSWALTSAEINAIGDWTDLRVRGTVTQVGNSGISSVQSLITQTFLDIT